MNNLQVIQSELREWHDKNFPYSTAEDMLIGIMEEVGELAHTNLKRRQLGLVEQGDKEQDAIGDIVIFLMSYCNKRELDIASIIARTWNVVRQRDYGKVREEQRKLLDKKGK